MIYDRQDELEAFKRQNRFGSYGNDNAQMVKPKVMVSTNPKYKYLPKIQLILDSDYTTPWGKKEGTMRQYFMGTNKSPSKLKFIYKNWKDDL